VLGKAIKIIIFFTLGLALMWMIYSRVDAAYQEQCILDGIAGSDCNLIDKIVADISGANLWWLLAVIVTYLLSNISRAIKWQHLLRTMDYQPGFWNCFWTVMIGYFANLGFPRLGEVMRPGLLAKYENIPIEKVLGTVIVDRVVDIVFLAIFVGITFLVGWSDFIAMWRSLNLDNAEGDGPKSYLLYYIAAAAVIALLILFLTRNQSWSVKIRERLLQAIQGFKDGLLSVLRVDNMLAFIFHSGFIWICYYMMTIFGFQAFEPSQDLGWTAGLFLFILASLAMMIPTPGGMGSYHYFIMTGLMFYGIDKVQGFSFAMIMFILLHLGGNILFGLIGWVVLPIINDKQSKTA